MKFEQHKKLNQDFKEFVRDLPSLTIRSVQKVVAKSTKEARP
jgi:hypothetical protein